MNGKTREDLDAHRTRETPWEVIAKLFNSTHCFAHPEDEEFNLDPNSHTCERSAQTLKVPHYCPSKAPHRSCAMTC